MPRGVKVKDYLSMRQIFIRGFTIQLKIQGYGVCRQEHSGTMITFPNKPSGENSIKGSGQEYFTVMIALFQHGAGEPPGYILELTQ